MNSPLPAPDPQGSATITLHMTPIGEVDGLNWFEYDGEGWQRSPVSVGLDDGAVLVQPAALSSGDVDGIAERGGDDRVQEHHHGRIACGVDHQDISAIRGCLQIEGNEVDAFDQACLRARRRSFQHHIHLPALQVGLGVCGLLALHALHRLSMRGSK